MANIEDFSRIGFVLDNFTDARVIPVTELDSETEKLTKAWRNSDNTQAPLVQFSMPVNGIYYVVEAVPSSKANIMAVVSAYMTSGGKKSQHPQSSAEPAGIQETPTSSLTPEALHELLGADNSRISQPGQTVNSEPETFFEKNAEWAGWNDQKEKERVSIENETISRYNNIIQGHISIGQSAVFNEAKNGGRHKGIYADAMKKSRTQLEKSIASHTAQVEEHASKIADPPMYAEDWAQRSENSQEGLIRKWEKDRRRNAEQAGIEILVWKERFERDV